MTLDNQLIEAAKRNKHGEVQRLLNCGADVNADNSDALRWAARNGHTDVVRVLLEHGADVHTRDDEALRWASRYGYTDVVRLLIEHDADVHAWGNCALRWAAANGHVDVIQLLEQHKNAKAPLEEPRTKFNTEQYLQFVSQLFGDMETLIKAKNADYTTDDGPFANFEAAKDFGIDPIAGLANRMSDKFQRIKSYCKKGKLEVAGEGLEDAFKDLIGYSALALGMLAERELDKKEERS